MVKGNTFRCVKKGHTIESITAVVPVINHNGNIVERNVPAGYCKNCRIYFIRENTFQRLKSSGTIACRVKEEKTYYHGDKHYGDLALQSVLMEYGYSVSSTRNLSAVTRHKILSTLIDYNIISKSEIIDYLEFFIRQRKNQSKNYTDAIDKWTSDIQFVSRYKKTNSQTVNVKSIQYRTYYRN